MQQKYMWLIGGVVLGAILVKKSATVDSLASKAAAIIPV